MATKDDLYLRDDRRASMRVPLAGRAVTIEHACKTLNGRGGDLNNDCLRIFVNEQPPVGATVIVRRTDDTDTDIVFNAVVERHRASTDDGRS